MAKHIAVLDIGTTSLKCFIFDRNFAIVSSASKDVQLLYPQHGFVEIEPENLLENVLSVIREAVNDAKISFKDIILGISTQRGYIELRHNFIAV